MVYYLTLSNKCPVLLEDGFSGQSVNRCAERSIFVNDKNL